MNKTQYDPIARLAELKAQNKMLAKTLKWLDRWMGDKSLLECANRVREALAAVEGEKK